MICPVARIGCGGGESRVIIGNDETNEEHGQHEEEEERRIRTKVFRIADGTVF